ncbi:hypothetical protein ON010_g8637 [Phytophthora cinnamomi]|nr:hypothetical protein ON010_g8637 [Phytophthora cinnamomi]
MDSVTVKQAAAADARPAVGKCPVVADTIDPNANLCVMLCPYCQKSVAVASDTSSSEAIDTIPSVVEDNSFSDGSKGISAGEPDFLAAVKKTSQSVMPACCGEKKRPSTPSVRSVESGASRPVPVWYRRAAATAPDREEWRVGGQVPVVSRIVQDVHHDEQALKH